MHFFSGSSSNILKIDPDSRDGGFTCPKFGNPGGGVLGRLDDIVGSPDDEVKNLGDTVEWLGTVGNLDDAIEENPDDIALRPDSLPERPDNIALRFGILNPGPPVCNSKN